MVGFFFWGWGGLFPFYDDDGFMSNEGLKLILFCFFFNVGVVEFLKAKALGGASTG